MTPPEQRHFRKLEQEFGDTHYVFPQINSLDALEAKYPGEAVLPFNTGTSNAQPSQEQNQSNVNDEFSAILIDILKAMYFELGSEDMSVSFDCVVHFDDQQRILQFENLLVNGEPKMPSFDLTEKVNMISQHIHKLPAKYKLKSVKYSVSPGGDMKIDSVFVE